VYGFKRYNVYRERDVAVRFSGIMMEFMAINVIRERERERAFKGIVARDGFLSYFIPYSLDIMNKFFFSICIIIF
jgi:hypothetical protein